MSPRASEFPPGLRAHSAGGPLFLTRRLRGGRRRRCRQRLCQPPPYEGCAVADACTSACRGAPTPPAGRHFFSGAPTAFSRSTRRAPWPRGRCSSSTYRAGGGGCSSCRMRWPPSYSPRTRASRELSRPLDLLTSPDPRRSHVSVSPQTTDAPNTGAAIPSAAVGNRVSVPSGQAVGGISASTARSLSPPHRPGWQRAAAH